VSKGWPETHGALKTKKARGACDGRLTIFLAWASHVRMD